ncbi:AAA family ATPase [Nocardioides sp. CGMCC 1.13656]|uniref:helix-turn-helix transcriptional regulator n=1 Tax=Nocardioides TaxID=1839 RepID=UPI0012FB54F0|nr:LuxR family transcriptional regulator [Nocardioides sp. CGMCC 1.13656]MBA2956172.1 AAA family ATPase [Nocardioides sp. CGMCC 1.13656]
MLRGRDLEQATLREVVARARAGQGSALLLRGQPGVGKSALLEDAVTAADDLTVLRTRGVESEAPLPFAALHRLLRPVLNRLDGLPAPQASALRAAFGESTDDVGDRHLVFLATLNLLSEVAGERPVVAVVDDAHWLDDASAAALLFASRRLEGEAVALLFAIRDDETGAFDSRDMTVLTVSGVDAGAAEALIADQLGATVAPHVRAELLEVTAGNPLGLLELTRALSADQLSGHARLPDRLPLTEGVERTFLDRYRRLPPPAQTLLLVAAADDSGRASTVSRAAHTLGAGTDAMDAAEESGLLAEDDGMLTLRHPLVRSAIYGAATGSKRRQVHRALADALAGTPQEDRRAWHLAASVDGPDDEVVGALDEAAERARRRGGHEAAAAAWTRAAELTLDPDTRARRLFWAAGSSVAAGHPIEADRLARAALMDATDPLLRADLVALQAQVEWNSGSLDDGYRLVCQAATIAAPHDSARARLLAMLAAALASFGARSGDAPDPTTIAPPPSADAPPEDRVAGWLLDGFSAVLRDDWVEAASALRRAWETPIAPDAPPMLHHNLAIATMHLGDDARAIRLHDLQLQHAREASAVNMVEHALTRGVVYRIATGAWSQAASYAQEAVLLDRNLGLEELVTLPLAELAVITALRGDPQASAHLHELERALEQHPPRGTITGLVGGLSRWAAARQLDITPATALHHYEQIELPVARGLTALDRIETAIRADRRDLAEEWLGELLAFAEGTDMAWAWAAVHHGRAVLGDGEVEENFRTALEWHARSSRLPARARTQLALGEFLRRNRRRSDARAPLRDALETFESLGASFWAERARQELRASGETARRGADLVATELTAQESQVAGLVRQGLSNKDVAGRLFISPRTVDFHLRNVYTKLGISSRTELAALTLDPD